MAVRIFDSISRTKTHNHVLEANLYNCVACQELFVIPLPMFYKPMIEVIIYSIPVKDRGHTNSPIILDQKWINF